MDSFKPLKTGFEFPLGIMAIVVVIAVFIIFLILFKTGFIYIEDVPKKKPTKRKKSKKGNTSKRK
jgi:hypothetical protein